MYYLLLFTITGLIKKYWITLTRLTLLLEFQSSISEKLCFITWLHSYQTFKENIYIFNTLQREPDQRVLNKQGFWPLEHVYGSCYKSYISVYLYPGGKGHHVDSFNVRPKILGLRQPLRIDFYQVNQVLHLDSYNS